MTGFEIKGRKLKTALTHLASADDDLARSLLEIGPPPPRSSEAGFAGLLRIIMGQQLSVASARAIWTHRLIRVRSAAMFLPSEPCRRGCRRFCRKVMAFRSQPSPILVL